MDKGDLDEAMRDMDKDNSGEITWSEFKRWFYQSESEQEAAPGEGPKLTGDADIDAQIMKEHEAKLKLEQEGPPRRKCDVRGVQIIFDVWDEDGDDWWQRADLEAFARATKSFGIEGKLSEEQYEVGPYRASVATDASAHIFRAQGGGAAAGGALLSLLLPCSALLFSVLPSLFSLSLLSLFLFSLSLLSPFYCPLCLSHACSGRLDSKAPQNSL